MRLRVGVILGLVTLVMVAWFLWHREGETLQAEANDLATATDGNSVPVLVELFTSEGCSSCPPADRLLTELDGQPISGVQVIALSEHVDYWNRLGWTDPFSSSEFSERQNEYAATLHSDDVYTPQMIVDGRVQFVGSNASKARQAITAASRAPKANVILKLAAPETPDSLTLKVEITNLPGGTQGDSADVMLAITEDGLRSNVSSGENSGRKLTHSAVTRSLTRIGTINGPRFASEQKVALNGKWKRESLHAIAFVQERSSRKVFGAASLRLNTEP
jgi:hypothetical protein